MPTGVILLAAGRGSRLGHALPKQFLKVGQEPLFLKSFRTFAALPSIGEIVIVAETKHQPRIAKAVKRLKPTALVTMVAGGSFRGQSVRNGLRAFSRRWDVVLVHDTARPLVSKDAIRRVESAAQKHGVALAAWPLPDTLKQENEKGFVKKTIPRQKLWLAQTPQGFRGDVAWPCLSRPSPTATDDVQLAERRGLRVKIVEGSPLNFKVTYAHDFQLCEALLKNTP